MISIESVHMAGNRLESIESLTFSDLTKLKSLDLSHNLLKSDEFIEHIAPLRALNLANNHFQYINLTQLKHIEHVSLLNNHWNCSWITKSLISNQHGRNIIFGVDYNDIIDDNIEQRIGEEVDCMDYRNAETGFPLLKTIVFIHSNDGSDCSKKLEKVRESM